MSMNLPDAVLNDVLGPVARCFTPEVAREVAALRADSRLQARLDALAEKANEGELTDEERDEYDAYVEAIDLLSVLQTQARQILEKTETS